MPLAILLLWVSQWIGHSQCEEWTKESWRTVLTLAPEVQWVDDIPVSQDHFPIFLPPPPITGPLALLLSRLLLRQLMFQFISGSARKIYHSEIYHRKFDLAQNTPPY